MIDSLNPRTMENQIHELEKRPSVEVVANPSGSTGSHVLKKIQIGSTKYAIGGDASNITYGDSDVDSTLDGMKQIQEYTIPTDPDDYGTFVFKRQGDVVCFQIRNPKSLTASAWTTVGNVPAEFRPLSDLYAYFVIPATSGDTIGMLLQPNGDLRLYNYTTNTGSINTSYLGSFIIS